MDQEQGAILAVAILAALADSHSMLADARGAATRAQSQRRLAIGLS